VPKRSYEQYCGLARALDLVGERWTLLIVRDLSMGPQRYTDLLAGLPGIGSGLLAERLKQLEAEGLARRAKLPPPAAVPVYELTDEGEELASSLAPLALWGARRLGPKEQSLFRADWLLVMLRAVFDPNAAAGVHDTYEFEIDGEVLHVMVDDGRLRTARGPAPGRTDIRVRTDAETFIAVGTGQLSPTDALDQGRAEFDGSPEALTRCLRVFNSVPVTAG
jgi:DNA-binding HxlR family transcriptional regulator